MKAITHYYRPPRMTRTSNGNVKACCERPESDHPVWVDGVTVRIKLTRSFSDGAGRHHFAKGQVITVTRAAFTAMQEVRKDRWGTVPSTGLIGMLEKGEYRDVTCPGYNIPLGKSYSMGIPDTYGREV